MSEQEGITLIDFMERFNTEEKCRTYLYNMNRSKGFVCPKCGAIHEPFNIKSRNVYQCKFCNHQTTVTAGTVPDKTRTPLVKWFLAIYLISNDKRGCSALMLKKELSIRYDTAWTIKHKILSTMKNRDNDYLLSGIAEVDEAFFGGGDENSKKGEEQRKLP
jgi:transposase-like protein